MNKKQYGTIESKLSPIRGEFVPLSRYKSFFSGLYGPTDESLLERHIQASADAFPWREEEFLVFYEDTLLDLAYKRIKDVSKSIRSGVPTLSRPASSRGPLSSAILWGLLKVISALPKRCKIWLRRQIVKYLES